MWRFSIFWCMFFLLKFRKEFQNFQDIFRIFYVKLSCQVYNSDSYRFPYIINTTDFTVRFMSSYKSGPGFVFHWECRISEIDIPTATPSPIETITGMWSEWKSGQCSVSCGEGQCFEKYDISRIHIRFPNNKRIFFPEVKYK